MRVIEYIGEVLSDGHLSLPDEIRKELGLSPHLNVRITITMETSRALDEVVHEVTAERSEAENQRMRLFEAERSEQKGWEVFRRLGQDAIGGKLSDASTKHDQYLYGKER